MDIGNFYGLKRRGTPGKISLAERAAPSNENDKTSGIGKDDLAVARLRFSQSHGRLHPEAVYAAERRKKNIAESQRRYVIVMFPGMNSV
jgi:hypothetical protein